MVFLYFCISVFWNSKSWEVRAWSSEPLERKNIIYTPRPEKIRNRRKEGETQPISCFFLYFWRLWKAKMWRNERKTYWAAALKYRVAFPLRVLQKSGSPDGGGLEVHSSCHPGSWTLFAILAELLECRLLDNVAAQSGWRTFSFHISHFFSIFWLSRSSCEAGRCQDRKGFKGGRFKRFL